MLASNGGGEERIQGQLDRLKNWKSMGFQNRQKSVGKPMKLIKNHFCYDKLLWFLSKTN
jgi:hypothetical protein